MSCIKNLKFSPKELTSNVKRESACHKAKVVGWSAFMVLVAGSYLSTFADLTTRATQLQNQALAGNLDFNDYFDWSDEATQLQFRTIRDIYEQKDAKDLQYIEKGWKSKVGKDSNGNAVAWGPQGDPLKQDWYTQTERADFSKIETINDTFTPAELVEYYSKRYDEWAKMHDSSVVWYDTAGCNFGNNGMIGQASFVKWSPKADQFKVQGEAYWYVGDKKNPAPIVDGEDDWNTDIYAEAGQFKVHDDLNEAKSIIDIWIDMADCDIDCQAKGSQMTLVAALNEVSLALIVLNGLFGIWGGWSAIGRMSQTYCTFIAFIFQLVILIVCATMLFTPYARQCFRSLTPTASLSESNEMWTMHDDYITVISLWATQFVWVFVFLFIGLCGAVRSEPSEILPTK